MDGKDNKMDGDGKEQEQESSDDEKMAEKKKKKKRSSQKNKGKDAKNQRPYRRNVPIPLVFVHKSTEDGTSRSRFLELMSNLNLDSYQSKENKSPMFKIGNIHKQLKKSFGKQELFEINTGESDDPYFIRDFTMCVLIPSTYVYPNRKSSFNFKHGNESGDASDSKNNAITLVSNNYFYFNILPEK